MAASPSLTSTKPNKKSAPSSQPTQGGPNPKLMSFQTTAWKSEAPSFVKKVPIILSQDSLATKASSKFGKKTKMTTRLTIQLSRQPGL